MFKTHLKKFLKNYIYNKFLLNIVYIFIKLYFYVFSIFLFSLSKKYSSFHTKIYRLLYWVLSKKKQSYYNHEINLYNWIYDPSIVQFVEGGVLARILIKKKSKVLDICCGDGMYAYLFLSDYAKKVDTIDINKEYIDIAKKKYKKKNINFINANILKYNFKKKYDLVVWSEGAAYFSEFERKIIYQKIYKILNDNGIFFIRTPLEKKKNDSANQVDVIVNKNLFEKSWEKFYNIKHQQMTDYHERVYLNYYLIRKKKK